MPAPGGAAHEFEIPILTRAKVLLAEGSPASLAGAEAILEDLLQHAVRSHSVPLQITLLAHRALLLQTQGRADIALSTIADALALAEARGFFRAFVDFGAPMARLLDLYLQRADASPLAARLIDAIRAPRAAPPPELRPALSAPVVDAAPIVERLTERELDVLDGLAKRLSNKEIAEALAISPHTIKRHTASIYGKLGVSSQRQAVRRAMAVGLVPNA